MEWSSEGFGLNWTQYQIKSILLYGNLQFNTEPTQMLNRIVENELWCIHTIEYYTAVKMDKLLMHAATWVTLKNKSSKRNQTQRVHIVWFDLYEAQDQANYVYRNYNVSYCWWKIFWDDGNVLYPELSSSYTGVYIYTKKKIIKWYP